LTACWKRFLFFSSVLTILLTLLAPAQQTPPAAPQSQAQSASPQEPQPQPEAGASKTPNEKEIEKQEQSQRMLGVVPQFSVTSRQNAPPLTPGEKFRLFWKTAFDPATIGIVGFQAAISQAEDEFPEYGQGAAGYGKRYGASLADQVSSGFFTNFFYPVLLKEDPRYFRLGEGGFKIRLSYSIRQEVVCHTDHGGRSFSWENVLGALSSGGLSNAYYPAADRGFGLTMSRTGISLLYGSLGGIVDEFYPDVNRRLFHRHQKAAQTITAQPSPAAP